MQHYRGQKVSHRAVTSVCASSSRQGTAVICEANAVWRHSLSVAWLVLRLGSVAGPQGTRRSAKFLRRCYVGKPTMAQTATKATTAPRTEMARTVTMRPLMMPPRASTGVRSRCMASSKRFYKFGGCFLQHGDRAGVASLLEPSDRATAPGHSDRGQILDFVLEHALLVVEQVT
jgi:hypothetical protein